MVPNPSSTEPVALICAGGTQSIPIITQRHTMPAAVMTLRTAARPFSSARPFAAAQQPAYAARAIAPSTIPARVAPLYVTRSAPSYNTAPSVSEIDRRTACMATYSAAPATNEKYAAKANGAALFCVFCSRPRTNRTTERTANISVQVSAAVTISVQKTMGRYSETA